MIKRMALAIFLFAIFSHTGLANPTVAPAPLTYHEIAKICYQYRNKVSISDCIACYSDVIKYCSHIKEADGLQKLANCLRENMDNLKSTCKRVLQKNHRLH